MGMLRPVGVTSWSAHSLGSSSIFIAAPFSLHDFSSLISNIFYIYDSKLVRLHFSRQHWIVSVKASNDSIIWADNLFWSAFSWENLINCQNEEWDRKAARLSSGVGPALRILSNFSHYTSTLWHSLGSAWPHQYNSYLCNYNYSQFLMIQDCWEVLKDVFSLANEATEISDRLIRKSTDCGHEAITD